MNDDEIIALFYDRDEQALTEIQNRFSGKCYCVAWRILKNHEDCEEYPFDVIFTGYNDTFESGTMELGAFEVFFVEVKPSSFTSGERVYTSDGYRKFYWSDGLYIFTLETSFAVTDDVVRMALESFSPVDDISEYESVRLVEPDTPTEPTSGPVVQEIWLPTHIPQG